MKTTKNPSGYPVSPAILSWVAGVAAAESRASRDHSAVDVHGPAVHSPESKVRGTMPVDDAAIRVCQRLSLRASAFHALIFYDIPR